MRRMVLGMTFILGLGSMILVTAAFVVPSDEVVEPSNARLNFGHETTYDSFTPIHYPEHGIFVLRHQSWRMSVYLDRDPTSGCLLEWIRGGEVAVTLRADSLRGTTRGAFHDPGLGTVYAPNGEVIRGPGDKPLSLVSHTMPYNTVQVIEGDIWEAEPFISQRVCSE